MNFLAPFLIIGTFSLSLLAAEECESVPKLDAKACCKLPEMIDASTYTDIVKSLSDVTDEELKGCKIATKIFEHYKLLKSDGSLDLTAAVETTKDLIKDTEWLNVTQSALKVCSTNADDNLATYQSAVKFTKEECNIKYRSIISCLDIYGFASCPKSSWKETDDCTSGKNFVHKCYKNIEAMGKFYKNFMF